MALLLVHRVLVRPAADRQSRGNVALLGSTALLPPRAPPPPYAILDGDEGMERTIGGDIEPCKLCKVLRLDEDRVWTGL